MNGHPIRDEDFDLYALGALDGEDLAAFESHVATCDSCRQKLAAARDRIALLALSAPSAPPSPGVKERLMRQLSAEAEGREPSIPEPAPARAVFGANWWTAIFAPAAAALALATVLLWVSNNRLNDQIDRQRAQLQELKHQTDEINALLELASARDTVSVSLAPSPEAHGATAHVLYNARMGKMFYSDTMTTAAPPDKSFQLWLVPMSGNPVSAGILTPEPGVGSRMMVTMPPGMPAKAFAVTIEPAGGMPEPTGPKILVGPVT